MIVIGSRITQRRKQKHILQSDLAEAIGVTNNQISNIENGHSYPKLKNLISICEVLDCNADYLLSGIIKKEVDANIIDMIASLTLEEQITLWKLLDCYIHRDNSL